MIITREHIIAELDNLIRDERLLEKLLERASRAPQARPPSRNAWEQNARADSPLGLRAIVPLLRAWRESSWSP